MAVNQLADIAFDELEAGPLRWRDQALHLIEVALMAGGEVVQPTTRWSSSSRVCSRFEPMKPATPVVSATSAVQRGSVCRRC